MEGRIWAAVCAIAICQSAMAVDRYPRFTTAFSAIESKGYPDAQAYQFQLQCNGQECTLQRITLEECKDADDRRGEVMNVWASSFSTKDHSLSIEFQSSRSLRMQFTWTDAPYNADFRISVSFTEDLGRITASVSSVSGVVLKKAIVSKKEQSIELRQARTPLERLKRTCPIGLYAL